jgi:hypothetical protein
MKYLTIDSDNKILGWNEDAHTEGCIETDSVIPEYTDTQSLYWEGETVVAKDDDEKISMKAEYDSQAYARKRKAEYNALNQFEMQFDDKEDGTTTWEDAIAAIKTKYPKG